VAWCEDPLSRDDSALRGALVCDVAASAAPNTSAMMGSSPNVIRRMFSLYVTVLLRFNLGSCKRISRAPRLLPAWLHYATTDRMLESGIMVQPDLMAISYEELCDTNPSKPTCAPWHARSTRSANGGLCLSSVMPSVAYGASPIFRRVGVGKERPEHAPQKVGCVRNHGTGAGFGRQCLPGICPNPKRPGVVPGHRCFAPVGRESSLLPRRETSSGSGQRHRKTLSSASTQRERGNPHGERSGTGYCHELNGRSEADTL
jgi:hypothetical protein